MERTLLGTLCLLLALAGASLEDQQGEECWAWTYGPASTMFPFQCPKSLDGADARFCCGPCRSPFCCASEEARLDQKQCLRALRRLGALPSAPMEGTRLPSARQALKRVRKDQGPGEKTSRPPPRDLATLPSGHAAQREEARPYTLRPRPTLPPGRTQPGIHGFIWVLLGIAAILAVFCAICKFCPNPQECYTYLRHGQFTPPTPPPVHYSVRPPSPAAVHFDIGPPPYQKDDDLPPYYLRNPFDALARPTAQDRAACMELGVINLGFQEGGAPTASSATRVDSSTSDPTGDSAGTGEVAAKQVPSCAGEVASQLVPSGAGQVVPSGAGQVAAQVVPSGAGQVAAQVVPSGAGQVATQAVPSGAGQVAAQVVPAAKGAVISAPEPTRKRKAGPFAIYWESKESEL
uniref:Shisa N-terminal domain-containing protein n=1 Tax=Pogona vitticeps TaxID=103695 RepID=A0A6J0SY22_9SAUR